jgi:hypothetical protein
MIVSGERVGEVRGLAGAGGGVVGGDTLALDGVIVLRAA